MHIWWQLTSFGDNSILLPCAILVAVWLLTMHGTRQTGWWWLGAVVVAAAVVALSKVLFLAWNLYPPGFDFTGLSGDCTMAFLCWPVVGAFITARAPRGWRALMIGTGVFLGVIVAVSRVLLHGHTVMEVLLGSVWGMLLCVVFLYVTRGRLTVSTTDTWVPLAALALLLIVYGHGHSYNRVLGWAALRMSGHTSVYRRSDPGCAPKSRCSG